MASAAAILRRPRVLAAGLAMVIGGTSWLLLSSQPEPLLWSQGRGAVPDRFACLMYPQSADTFVLSVEDSRVVGPLDRAMLNDWSEITAGGFIEARHGDVRGRVALGDLRYLPDPSSPGDPMERWKETVLGWGEYRSIEVDSSPLGDGEEDVLVRLTHRDGGWESFRYRTDGESVRPLEWRAVTEAGAGLHGALAALVSGAIAFVSFAFCLLIAGIAVRWSRDRS